MRFALFLLMLLPASGCVEMASLIEPGYTEVVLEAATIHTMPLHPQGFNWDSSGAPDPFVVIESSDQRVLFRSSTIQDIARTPARLSLGDYLLTNLDDPIYVKLYDEDLMSHDLMAVWGPIRPRDLGGPFYGSGLTLQDCNGQPILQMHVRWGKAPTASSVVGR